MKRFLIWCRKPYLRLHFAEPEVHRVAEEAVRAVRHAVDTAQGATDLYTEALRKLDAARDELRAYFCSSMEPDAQIAELTRLQERSDSDHEF